MKKSFTLTEKFSKTPQELFEAWLESEQHASMTGAGAECSDREGGSFSAWDGYISGKNLRLTPYSEIIQSWRSTDFSDEDEDSSLTIRFKAIPEGCLVELIHENIPEVDADFEKGWKDYYFEPMQEFFSAD
jgi:activator of HSP90 ATPase